MMETQQMVIPWSFIIASTFCFGISSVHPFSISDTYGCRAKTCFSRNDAALFIDNLLLPVTEKGHRIGLGSKADQLRDVKVLDSKDPVLFESYGEFPIDSLDILLDRSESLLLPGKKRTTVVDVGSGCGRLALYMALSRHSWDVHGIEISPIYHNEAIQAATRAVQQGSLEHIYPTTDRSIEESVLDNSTLSLHCGPAQTLTDLLNCADLIFCYSTAFESAGFSEQVMTMLLGHDWTKVFSNTKSESLCITTDKALDPCCGWVIVDRVDVPNPEVFGSTGYIQRLTSSTS